MLKKIASQKNTNHNRRRGQLSKSNTRLFFYPSSLILTVHMEKQYQMQKKICQSEKKSFLIGIQ